MIHSILKRSLTAMLILLLGNMAIYAANDGLATQQITIKLDKAGTLPNKIGSSKKYKITNLKIIGDINGTDIRMIRDMAGRSYSGSETSGELSTLDLSEARVVKGGDYYYSGGKYSGPFYTKNDEIGDYTFCECLKLTMVKLPTSVTSIGSSAFLGCTGLTSINIPEGVTYISGFSGCTGLTSINIPEGVTGIGSSAFLGCTGLTSINIPEGVTGIGSSAFLGCTGLTSINIPKGVTYIYEYAFKGCTGLTSINIPENVTEIGNGAFSGCTGLTSINIPESVTEIGNAAFSDCTGLTSINIPEGVTYISGFSGCTGLTSINIPEGVTKIGWYAFEGCIGLTSINIPKSVTEIDWCAFSDCTGLTSIYTYGITPASVSKYTFNGIDKKSCTLYVPTGSYSMYWVADFWGDFENIVEFDPATGINYTTTQPEATKVSRYTLDGQKLNAPAKGLNIVKYSDGTVKKVVVK